MLAPFFFNEMAPTEIYTLSLHDALPILSAIRQLMGSTAERTACHRHSKTLRRFASPRKIGPARTDFDHRGVRDRKSTRLNSSHSSISYAVFCLKKKKKKKCGEIQLRL